MSFEFIAQSLSHRKEAQLLRSRQLNKSTCVGRLSVAGKAYLNFSSNDYLGLANDEQLIEAWQQGAQYYGVGSGASPLVTGHCCAHQELEQHLCDWLGFEAAILFNSGFSANQAIIKALLSKEDLLLQDKLNHASLIEAGMMSEVKMKRFLHNDVQSLEKYLQIPAKNKLVVTEGVFSMDGDMAPIGQISQVANKHQAWLMLDDAHAIGVLGSQGQGSLENPQHVQIYMATFGKALGVGGAFIAGSQALIDYLINFARSYIYSTAMPPAMAYTVSQSINMVRQQTWRREKLQENIALFKQKCSQLPVQLLASDTAIQPILLGSAEKALNMSELLKKQGYWVSAIRPPTVPNNTARCRITLSASHSSADIAQLVKAIELALSELAG